MTSNSVFLRDSWLHNPADLCLWSLVPFLGFFLFIWAFFFSYSNVLDFLFSYYMLFHFILFYCYPLKACLLSNGRQEGGGTRWEERQGGTWRRRGRETMIKIYYVRVKKKYIFNRRGKLLWKDSSWISQITPSESHDCCQQHNFALKSVSPSPDMALLPEMLAPPWFSKWPGSLEPCKQQAELWQGVPGPWTITNDPLFN